MIMLLGKSPALLEVTNAAGLIAATDVTALIHGESGSGKELLARSIHAGSRRSRQPFVTVNCATLASSSAESQLFGHVEGAFASATSDHDGYIQQAAGGTLFLDEVADLPVEVQAKLLQLLESGEIVPLGAADPVQIDLRIVAATSKDLQQEVAAGNLREDLFYRINVVHIHIPALRERKEDILWFARRFLDQYMEEHPGERKSIERGTEQLLLHQSWPGNLRQLKHCIERACVLSPHDVLSTNSLLSDQLPLSDSGDVDVDQPEASLSSHLRGLERDYIIKTLNQNHWQIAATAKALDISRKHLWEKTKKLGISEGMR
jgi:DNA-binding NtrC family response regulator